MNHDAAIKANLDQASEQFNKIQGNHPTEVVQAAMSVANAFLSAALVEAVRELSDEVRQLREAR